MNIEPSLKELMVKTQCPHCRTKFKAPDEHEGKKVKCPKCEKPFVIAPFEENTRVELCTRCGRIIGKLEQTCVFRGNIVCSECDQNLRKTEAVITSQEEERPGETAEEVRGAVVQSPKPVKRTMWLPLQQANKTGITVAVVVMIVGFCCLLLWIISGTETREITLGGYPKIDEQGNLGEYVKKQTIKATSRPDVWSVVFRLGTLAGATLCLMLRSFRQGLGFWRGVLTLLGGSMVGITISVIVFLVVDLRLPLTSTYFVIQILILVLGAMLLRISFRPKKGFA